MANTQFHWPRKALDAAIQRGLGRPLLGAGILSLLTLFSMAQRPEESQVVRAKPRSHLTIEAYGIAAARESEAHFSPVQGLAAKLLWLPEEGVDVRAGDAIAKVDDFEIEQRLRNEESQLGDLRDDALAAGEENASRKVLDEAELRALRDEAVVAEAELVRMERFELPGKAAELRLAVEVAEQAKEEAQRKVEVVEEFLGRGFASSAERDSAGRELQVQSSRLEGAQAQERSFLEGGKEASHSKKVVEISRLRAKVADLEQRVVSARPRGEQRLENLSRAIARGEAQVADLRRQLEGSTIRARSAGTVVFGEVKDANGARRSVQVGDLVWSNVVLVRVSDLSQQDFIVRIPEQRVRSVVAGQRALVRLSADPGDVIGASVRRVGFVSSDPESGVRSLEVKLELERPPFWVRPGMSGKARIEVGVPAGSTALPHLALRLDGDRTYIVERTWWWGSREREVRVVAETPGGVALEGLEPGTRVLLPDPKL